MEERTKRRRSICHFVVVCQPGGSRTTGSLSDTIIINGALTKIASLLARRHVHPCHLLFDSISDVNLAPPGASVKLALCSGVVVAAHFLIFGAFTEEGGTLAAVTKLTPAEGRFHFTNPAWYNRLSRVMPTQIESTLSRACQSDLWRLFIALWCLV